MVNKELKEAETIFLKNKSKEEIYQYLLKRKLKVTNTLVLIFN